MMKSEKVVSPEVKYYQDDPKPVVDCSGDEPLTQQSDAAECDINTIVARAKAGADISRLVRAEGQYGDWSNLPDFRTMLNMVNKARDQFMALDAQVRKRFNNDPAQLLDFLGDEKNRDEAVKLGLVKAPDGPKTPDPIVSELQALRKDISASKSKKPKAAEDGE